MTPEEKARVKIDKQLKSAGWDIVARQEYLPKSTSAVKEALMKGNKESDYLLFIDDKAVAVVEAKKEDNPLGPEVVKQAEWYAMHPQSWYGLWFDGMIPLVYMANGGKIYFKNMLEPDSDYIELSAMHSPKKMLKLIGKTSEYGALPTLDKRGLRDCQYDAEIALENSLKSGERKNLAILATGSGKTYLACLAAYRLLNYTSTRRVLFLVDRNNLARQTKSEFSLFDRTENQQALSSLYEIKRLKKESDIKADVVISTIQKLFAILTGQSLQEGNEDAEDEFTEQSEEKYGSNEPAIRLQDDLKLPPDYFQFIVVDECHRSIYGKWKSVLEYFKDAKILGLTATPTPEAYAFFNNNVIEQYTFDDSVVDGVNVPARVYRIVTDITKHGGTIKKQTKVTETARKTGETETYSTPTNVDYQPTELDRSVVNRDQIRTVLTSYRDAIYSDLYPEREKRWEYIPKTLIFAKDDHHATEIVEIASEVFGEVFEDGKVPDHFVQKITYTSGDTDALIRDLRIEKSFRIGVTVTLVATGTDVKPLEVVLFMKDVMSDTLYTQMKGRGCRVISDDLIKEVTPNAQTKDCYYIVDAVGVTEHEKYIPVPGPDTTYGKMMSLEILLEHLAHNELSDENLILLRNYCASINRRYEDNTLFSRHLDYFISTYGFAPKTIANRINNAFEQGTLVEYVSSSQDNSIRFALIGILINNIQARKKLLEMQHGYYVEISDKDTLIYSGFSKETARTYIENLKKYLEDNKDSMEVLRIAYNSEEKVITHEMLVDLKDHLLAESSQYSAYRIWQNYKILDEEGNVDELDSKSNVNALTNLLQIVRYTYKKNQKLSSLTNGYVQRFNLYCGQAQRVLSEPQKNIMKQIADYIVGDGSITPGELNAIDADLWRNAITNFGASALTDEMNVLSKFILRA
jgi:type I restriction enzyme R subunit